MLRDNRGSPFCTVSPTGLVTAGGVPAETTTHSNTDRKSYHLRSE